MTEHLTELDPLLSPRTIARCLALSTRTTYAMLAAGKIPSVRFGRTIRVRKSALYAWIRQGERPLSAGPKTEEPA